MIALTFNISKIIRGRLRFYLNISFRSSERNPEVKLVVSVFEGTDFTTAINIRVHDN